MALQLYYLTPKKQSSSEHVQILLFVCIHVHTIVCVSTDIQIHVQFIPISTQTASEVTAMSLIKILFHFPVLHPKAFDVKIFWT